MARDDDGHRVGGARRAHGAHRAGPAYRLRDLSVCARLPVRNCREALQHGPPETGGCTEINVDIECGSLAVEVFVELLGDGAEVSPCVLLPGVLRSDCCGAGRFDVLPRQPDVDERTVARNKKELTQRCLVGAVVKCQGAPAVGTGLVDGFNSMSVRAELEWFCLKRRWFVDGVADVLVTGVEVLK